MENSRRVWRRDDGAMLSGVCAGLAEDLDLPLPLVRVVAVIFLVLPTGLAYLALSLLLRRFPMHDKARWSPSGPAGAPRFSRSETSPGLPKNFALLVHRFEALEPRLKRIEAFVTSNDFELRRDFRRMGE